jgi:hypothetical protein
MPTIVETKFLEWTRGKNPKDARISIFNRIRDIPYAVVSALNDPDNYVEMLAINKGSCTPKHFLLCKMFQMLNLSVLYVVYRYRWDEFEHLYPQEMRGLAGQMPPGNHLACKVEIEDKIVLVDATLDSPLSVLGLPVNKDWNGLDDTLLPVIPCKEETLYHYSEAIMMPIQRTTNLTQRFYDSLNLWLESVRAKNNQIIP